MGQLGFYDLDKRLEAISAKGDPLEALNAIVPFESFRADIEAVVRPTPEERKSNAGRKPFDAVMMFKVLVLQTLYNLADEQVESPPGAFLRPPPPAIYALRDWTVKKANGKWYIAPTARFEDKPQWSKPYATLQRATTAIARKLADEVMKRHKRRCDYYGIND